MRALSIPVSVSTSSYSWLAAEISYAIMTPFREFPGPKLYLLLKDECLIDCTEIAEFR